MVGDRKTEYKIVRKNVKNINLRVSRRGDITVSAPFKMPERSIRAFVDSKSGWIGKRLDLIGNRTLLNTRSQFVNGSSVKVLGKEYRFEVEESGRDRVIMYDDSICVYSRDPNDPSVVEKQYLKWLRTLAEGVFAASAERMAALLAPHNIAMPAMSIRVMRARWGSCNFRHREIRLNLRLVKAPPFCIDYVMLHELAHLKYPNHSEEYYFFLSLLMPDWKFRKKKLNSETGISLW